MSKGPLDITYPSDGIPGEQEVASVNVPEIQTDTTALDANTGRKGWMIQNTGMNPIFVRLGDGASTTLYHFVLKGGTADNDGLGANFSQLNGPVYTGIVSIAGTTPKYVVTELS